mgnify:CR=1 FL=1
MDTGALKSKLHWTLEAVFDEDKQRKRINNTVENFSFIRKIMFNLLKKDKFKDSMVIKRLKADWGN